MGAFSQSSSSESSITSRADCLFGTMDASVVCFLAVLVGAFFLLAVVFFAFVVFFVTVFFEVAFFFVTFLGLRVVNHPSPFGTVLRAWALVSFVAVPSSIGKRITIFGVSLASRLGANRPSLRYTTVLWGG